MAGRADLVDFLLSKGANPRAKSLSGETPLAIARTYQMTEIVDKMEAAPNAEKSHSQPSPLLAHLPSSHVIRDDPVPYLDRTRLRRSKSEVLRGFRSSKPLNHGVTRQPLKKDDSKGRMRIGHRITSLISRDDHTHPSSTSMTSHGPFVLGTRLTDLPSGSFTKIGNFPMWRGDLDVFTCLVTLALTRDHFLIF